MSAPTGAPATIVVRPMLAEHGEQVRAVQAEGIATGDATFEQAPAPWADWDAGHLAEHRFVALDDGAGTVLGWVAASPVSGRCVYAGVVEVSVYVAAAARGRGVGRALLDAFVASTEAGGVWTIQAGIFTENAASLALHRSVGFAEVGVRRGLGLMGHGPRTGQWRDVVLLERRSTVVGV
ncbi:GNAT family N-acetyltransferase [Cellulomonas soli]|uniref:N-acetyltransferase n=1 Tax=Cellulomonas soli TaxID=931535 RepID=A0A512PFC0_9CELL|nr:GNAT family N-acetyltransferase [Cellulomonas soli]NYI59313.1 phosphinothricin acetyltransferase [Cellulomonas soli]GEP69899.1 N-acetyltransferase [Cellulomonas soli]